MAGWKDIREIAAWRLSREVKLRVDSFLERPEVRRRYRYCNQLSDAARSAPSNIAEGFGRFGNKQFANFARTAKASLVEVLNHLIDARDQNLLTDEEFQNRQHEIRKALKATVGLIRHLETSPDPPRPSSKRNEPEP